MPRLHAIAALFCLFILLSRATALAADTPLPDAGQEARAKALFWELRCVVCAGESIAESTVPVAQDIRASVRQMVAEGKSDEEIKTLLVSRYTESVLMTPSFAPHTALLWLGPLIVLALGGAILFAYFSARRIDPE